MNCVIATKNNKCWILVDDGTNAQMLSWPPPAVDAGCRNNFTSLVGEPKAIPDVVMDRGNLAVENDYGCIKPKLSIAKPFSDGVNPALRRVMVVFRIIDLGIFIGKNVESHPVIIVGGLEVIKMVGARIDVRGRSRWWYDRYVSQARREVRNKVRDFGFGGLIDLDF